MFVRQKGRGPTKMEKGREMLIVLRSSRTFSALVGRRPYIFLGYAKGTYTHMHDVPITN